MKYILIIDSAAHPFETLVEVIEFLNFHSPENYMCFEVMREVKFQRYFKEVEND